MKRTTIYLEDELHKKLKMMAVKNNRSMGNMITEALSLTVFLYEKGKEVPKTPQIKEMAKEVKQDMNKFYGKSEFEDFCKHAAMKGLCKFGCK